MPYHLPHLPMIKAGFMILGGSTVGGICGGCLFVVAIIGVRQVTHFEVEVRDAIALGLTLGGVVGTLGVWILQKLFSLSRDISVIKGAVQSIAGTVEMNARRLDEHIDRDSARAS